METLDIPIAPKHPVDRTKGRKYLFKNEVRIWGGNLWKCEHNKPHYSCKKCKGSGVCEHNKERYRCKECKGKGICEHDRIRSQCKDCKGGSICEHNKKRTICKDCKGGSICEHGRIRSTCKDCKGGSICEHGRIRSTCKDCKGGSMCIHKRKRYNCKDCNGNGICHHNRQRVRCRQCKGGGICQHDKIRTNCRICFVDPKNWCQLCKYTWVHNGKYEPYCYGCFLYLNPDTIISNKYFSKERYINKFLLNNFPFIIHNQKIPSAISSRRPDWFLDLGTHIIITECDENQHDGYQCEEKRMMELFQDGGKRPAVFIRFNPDEYTSDKNYSSCFIFDSDNKILPTEEWDRRKEILLNTVINAQFIPEKEITIIKLFYTEEEANERDDE
jgi:hypothetical protein